MQRTGRLFPRGLSLALVLTVLFCTLGAGSAVAQGQGQAVITNNYANIRSGPGTKYKRLGRAYSGDRFPVTGSRADWTRIVFKGREAWVFNRLIRLEQAGPSAAEVEHLEMQIENLNQRVEQVTDKVENVRQTLEQSINEMRPEEPTAPAQNRKKSALALTPPREVRPVGAAWAFLPGASRLRQGQSRRGYLTLGAFTGCAAAGAWAWLSYQDLRDDYRALPVGSPQEEFDRRLSRADDRRNLAVGLLAGAAGLYAFNVIDHFLFLPKPTLALAPVGDSGERINLSLTCNF